MLIKLLGDEENYTLSMTDHNKVKDFYLWDYEGTLFPMETCRVLISNYSENIAAHILKIADKKEKEEEKEKEKEYCFLPQETVYASKTQHHLRRTLKLDPVAEYYLYEMAYKNRKIFRKSIKATRQNYGYRFYKGNPIGIHDSYNKFLTQAEKLKKKYKYFIKCDISAYFNSIYHHDMVNWFSAQKTTKTDVNLFGQFMREINTGFSIDFLPHGLYPSKMLGSHFLYFIDSSELLKCEHMIRFMDDFMLFSDSKDILIKDFQTIQKALGQKSLNINTEKTVLFTEIETSVPDKIDDIKSQIMEKIYIGSGSGTDYEDYEEAVRDMTEDEIEYLINLINEDSATDYEASLILDCIHEHHEHTEEFYNYIPEFIYRFPHLSKKIYHKCGDIEAHDELTYSLSALLKGAHSLNEYQLFWIAKIAEEYLLETEPVGELFALLYEHKNATNISKAKILEIPESRFGMPEWREVHLKNGSSGWLSWASAVGMRKDTKLNRNYLMGYFSKVSVINKLIGDCIVSL